MNRSPALRPALAGLLFIALCAFCAACAATRPSTSAAPDEASPRQNQAAGIVAESARTLRELRAASKQHILDYAIEDARAIIILPGLYQIGFYYSLHGGNGVLVARRPDGGWGAPALLSVGGTGIGIQIGLEKSRLVLAVMEDEMLERILTSGLTFDASAKYDVLGVREETSRGSLTERRPVMAFSDGVGLMAGVALRGGVLTVNQGLTSAYHGPGFADTQAVLASTNAPGLEVFELWSALVVDLPQEQIIRQKRP